MSFGGDYSQYSQHPPGGAPFGGPEHIPPESSKPEGHIGPKSISSQADLKKQIESVKAEVESVSKQSVFKPSDLDTVFGLMTRINILARDGRFGGSQLSPLLEDMKKLAERLDLATRQGEVEVRRTDPKIAEHMELLQAKVDSLKFTPLHVSPAEIKEHAAKLKESREPEREVKASAAAAARGLPSADKAIDLTQRDFYYPKINEDDAHKLLQPGKYLISPSTQFPNVQVVSFSYKEKETIVQDTLHIHQVEDGTWITLSKKETEGQPAQLVYTGSEPPYKSIEGLVFNTSIRKGFGKLTPLLEARGPSRPIEGQAQMYNFKKKTGPEAEAILEKSGLKNPFLIRESSENGFFAISHKPNGKKTTHTLLHCGSEGWSTYSGGKGRPIIHERGPFRTLDDLVANVLSHFQGVETPADKPSVWVKVDVPEEDIP